MKKIKILLTVAGIFFLIAAILFGILTLKTPQNINEKAAASTNLYILPRNQTVGNGDDISFSVAMDTGTNGVTGLDILLKFDPNIIHLTSLQKGLGIGNFDTIITNYYDNTAGTASFSVFTLNKAFAVSGTAIEVLQISAKVNQNADSGNSQITFDPTSAVAATNETQSVLVDMAPGTFSVIRKPTATPLPTLPPLPTATPLPTIAPTNAPGDPNSCNGTCGSNSNCQSNYVCFNGYCRNPNCTSQSSCVCSSLTPTPLPTSLPTQRPSVTLRPAQTVKPTKSPLPTAKVVNTKPTPSETDSPFWESIYIKPTPPAADLPTLAPIDLPDATNDNITPWIIGALVAGGIALLIIAYSVYKLTVHRRKPPVIKM